MSIKEIETTADLLASTREAVEVLGWVQGEYGSADGNVCTVGGMLWVLGEDEQLASNNRRVIDACRSLASAIGITTHSVEECGAPCNCSLNWITAWNDQDCRTKQDVLDALAKAEKIERAGYDPDLGYTDV